MGVIALRVEEFIAGDQKGYKWRSGEPKETSSPSPATWAVRTSRALFFRKSFSQQELWKSEMHSETFVLSIAKDSCMTGPRHIRFILSMCSVEDRILTRLAH